MEKVEATVTIALEEFLVMRDKAVSFDNLVSYGFKRDTDYNHDPVLRLDKAGVPFFEEMAKKIYPEAEHISVNTYASLADITLPKNIPDEIPEPEEIV